MIEAFYMSEWCSGLTFVMRPKLIGFAGHLQFVTGAFYVKCVHMSC